MGSGQVRIECSGLASQKGHKTMATRVTRETDGSTSVQKSAGKKKLVATTRQKQETRQVNVRMPVALIEFLDYAVGEGSEHLPHRFRPRTRSDFVKTLLVGGILDAIYAAPETRWLISCRTQTEEHREHHGKHAKECDEEPKGENLGDRFGVCKTLADAEKKLKEFLISEEGYMEGYGRRDFEIYPVDEKEQPLDDLLRSKLGADYDDYVALRRAMRSRIQNMDFSSVSRP